MLKFKKIYPCKDETYQVAYDDHCLVVKSGSKEDSPGIWLSKAMANWIARNFADCAKGACRT